MILWTDYELEGTRHLALAGKEAAETLTAQLSASTCSSCVAGDQLVVRSLCLRVGHGEAERHSLSGGSGVRPAPCAEGV